MRMTGTMGIDEARRLWASPEGWLNTAAYGLPPQPVWDAVQRALADWRDGQGTVEDWDGATQLARESFARLVGVRVADVCVGSQVSQLLAPVGAALPDGARVLVPEIEFTSTLFPWLAHGDRGVRVTTVPAARLLDHIEPGLDLVAFSLVQSATGEVAEYARICAAAREVGALVVVDATQACGWLPFDAGLADVVVVGAYKWLMAPRGSALAYLSPEVRERMRPLAAGWFAGADPHASFYGPPLRLAEDARRFDISPAWFSWVGTAPALELVGRVGLAAIEAHNVGLANRFLAGLGRPPGDSAIVIVDAPRAQEQLAAAGVRAAVRAGRVRASFHLYTSERDVDRALDALAG